MYSRQSDDGRTSTYGVSGKLWNGVLVMYDRDTESFWTQIDGRAIDGERLGERLPHVDSTYTTWAQWKAAHPDTLALRKPLDERERTGSLYADYLGDPDRLFLPELNEGLGGVSAKDVVFGMRADGDSVAVTEALLTRRGVVNVLIGDVPAAFVRDAETGAVTGVLRRLDGDVLVLRPAGATGKLRDAFSGVTLGAETLDPLRVDRSFWYGWKRTHPESRVLAD